MGPSDEKDQNALPPKAHFSFWWTARISTERSELIDRLAVLFEERNSDR
jgi:hypothetical protein